MYDNEVFFANIFTRYSSLLSGLKMKVINAQVGRRQKCRRRVIFTVSKNSTMTHKIVKPRFALKLEPHTSGKNLKNENIVKKY